MDGICCEKETQWNSGGKCCKKDEENSDGLCCKKGSKNQGGICCAEGLINIDMICCKPGEIVSRGICCPKGYHSSDGHCCKIDFTFYKEDDKEEGICLGPEFIPPIGEPCPEGREMTSQSICCPLGSYYAGESVCCQSGYLLDKGLCCGPGEFNSDGVCCFKGLKNSFGKCCPETEENKAGLCCLPHQINSNGHCCEQGEHYDQGRCCPVGLFNKNGICCQENEIFSKGKCCPVKHFYDQSLCCPEGTRNHQGICCHPELENRNNVCCDPSCGSCSGLAPSKCLSCPEGKKLIDGVCCNPNELLGLDGKCYQQDKCPQGSYPNSAEDKCSACTKNCLKCSGPGEGSCRSCSRTIKDLIHKENKCVCREGFYMNDRKTECLKCHETCRACQGPLKTDCFNCPYDVFIIRLMLNSKDSLTGWCLSCDENEDSKYCSSYLSTPIYATDIKQEEKKAFSKPSDIKSEKLTLKISEPPRRDLYSSESKICYPVETFEIIKEMGDEFKLNELYEISMSTGLEHDKDYSVSTNANPGDSCVEIFFSFKDHVDLERPEIEVTMNLKSRDYLNEWVEKKNQQSKRLLADGSGIQTGGAKKKTLIKQRLKNHSIFTKIVVETLSIAKKSRFLRFVGKVLFCLSLCFVLYKLTLLIYSISLKNTGYLSVKSISPLMAIQFFVKLPLIDLKFNPTMLAFLDSFFGLDSMKFWFLSGETWKERKRVSGKFLEYNIPAFTIHSVPLSLVLLTLSTLIKFIYYGRRVLVRDLNEYSKIERISTFLTSLVGLDVIFYSVFSLVVTHFSGYYVISVIAILMALISLISTIHQTWKVGQAIERENGRAAEEPPLWYRATSLIRAFFQPTKYLLHSSLIVLLRNEPRILIHSLIFLQILILGLQILDLCLFRNRPTSNSRLKILKESSLLVLFCLFRLIHQISMKSSSKHLWFLTIITVVIFILSLILSVVDHELEDWINFIKLNQGDAPDVPPDTNRIQMLPQEGEQSNQQGEDQQDGTESPRPETQSERRLVNRREMVKQNETETELTNLSTRRNGQRRTGKKDKSGKKNKRFINKSSKIDRKNAD